MTSSVPEASRLSIDRSGRACGASIAIGVRLDHQRGHPARGPWVLLGRRGPSKKPPPLSEDRSMPRLEKCHAGWIARQEAAGSADVAEVQQVSVVTGGTFPFVSEVDDEVAHSAGSRWPGGGLD